MYTGMGKDEELAICSRPNRVTTLTMEMSRIGDQLCYSDDDGDGDDDYDYDGDDDDDDDDDYDDDHDGDDDQPRCNDDAPSYLNPRIWLSIRPSVRVCHEKTL